VNKDDLIKLIYTAEGEELVKRMLQLSEEHRKKLATTAKTEYEKLLRIADTESAERREKLSRKLVSDLERLEILSKDTEVEAFLQGLTLDNAILAVLGCGSKTDAKRIQFWRADFSLDIVCKLLLERRPEWIGEWLEHNLNQDFSGVDWDLVSFCIKNDLCSRLDSDQYIEAMISGIENTWGDSAKDSVFTALGKNDWLFEYEIWRIFEVDSWCFEKYKGDAGDDSWRQALIKISIEKPEYKSRLLKKSLEGLFTSQKNPVHQGFIHFYNGFEINTSERKSLEVLYMSLLTSNKTFVVAFALKQLELLFLDDQLDNDSFFANTQRILSGDVKGQQKKCLKIYGKILKDHPDCYDRYLSIVAASLCTSNVDMQEKFIEILLANITKLTEQQFEVITNMSSFIPASLKVIFNKLVNEDVEVSLEIEDNVSDKIEILTNRVSLLSSGELETVGLQDFKATKEDLLSGTFHDNVNARFEVAPFEPVSHVDSIEELVELVGSALEICEDSNDFERILDGISRFNQQKIEGFSLLTDSIRSRLEKKPSEQGVCSLRFGVYELNRLILRWVAGHENIGEDDFYSESAQGFCCFLKNRVEEVKLRVLNKVESPLLSMPTHPFGFIAPEALIERLDFYLGNDIPVPHCDFQQALLRLSNAGLAEDKVQEALIASDSIYRRLIGFAMGGCCRFDSLSAELQPLWFVAAKARQLIDGDVGESAGFTLGEKQAQLLGNQEFSWEMVERKSASFYSGEEISFGKTLALLMNGREMEWAPGSEFLSCWTSKMHLQYLHRLWVREYASSNPLDLEVLFANGVRDLQELIDKGAITDTQLFALFEPFLLGYRNITETALRLIFLGLVSKNNDTQMAAIEAAIKLIEDEKLSVDSIIKVSLLLTAEGMVKQLRLNAAMTEISVVSNRHSFWVVEYIESYIKRLDHWPSSSHLLLELLLEQYHQLKCSPGKEICEKLTLNKGSSKLAKASIQIRKLDYSHQSPLLLADICKRVEQRLMQVG